MKKTAFIAFILVLSVLSTACINNLAVQELNNKAAQYMEKGDYENAISRLKSSIDLDGSIFETQYNLAVAYTENGDYEEAIEAFEKASALNPNSKDLYYSKAVLFENYAKDLYIGETKEQKEALKDADEKELQKKFTEDKYNPSESELDFVKKYYAACIENYTKYLEFDLDPDEASQIKERITELEDVIKIISSDIGTH